jgi:hypothetical protein
VFTPADPERGHKDEGTDGDAADDDEEVAIAGRVEGRVGAVEQHPRV